MSGIFGLCHFDGREPDERAMMSMDQRLAHRGPDGQAIWRAGPVAMGHRMLHTTPESLRELQPLVDPGSGAAVTADARIDNRVELAGALGLERMQTAGISDAALILAAYLRWGSDCAERLLGAFAFAIWDPRSRTMVCARDHFGIRPFVYYHGPDGPTRSSFAFASEVGAIVGVPWVPRRLNESRVADFLVPYFEDFRSTFFEGVFRLPPAHRLEAHEGGVRVTRYWRLDSERELKLGSDDEYVEAFRDTFDEAVRCRLRSAFPLGSTLSGGLDSSSVTCVAANLLAGAAPSTPIHTFSAVFPKGSQLDSRIDERAYMDAVLEAGPAGGSRYNLEPHFVDPEGRGPLESVMAYDDEPIPGPSLYMGAALHGAANAAGVRVLLCGQDGDTTVSHGYEYLEQLAAHGRWSEFGSQVRALAARRPGGNQLTYLRRFGHPSLAKAAAAGQWRLWLRQCGAARREFDVSVWDLAVRTGSPEWLRSSLRRARGRSGPPFWAALNSAISPRFARRTGISERIKGSPESNASSLREGHAVSITGGTWEFVLSTYDKIGSRNQVEQRYPFFDVRLVELCVSLPFAQRLSDGRTRWIQRRAMKGLLPESVRDRVGKGSLSIGVRLGLASELTFVERVLRDPGRIEPFVDLRAFRAAFARFRADPFTASERDVFTVFLPSTLALWMERSGVSA